MGWLILIVLLLIVLILLLSCVKIVPQATAMVVERLGGYRATWSVGLHVKAPFIDRVAKKEMCIRDRRCAESVEIWRDL